MEIIPRCSECEPGSPEPTSTEARCAHCGLFWRRTVIWKEHGGIAKGEYAYVAGDDVPTQKAATA